MEIGSKIKEKREQKTGLKTKWELNKVYPSIDMLIKMSDLFDISLDELIKGDKQFKKNNH